MMFKVKYVMINGNLPRIFTEVETHISMVKNNENCTSAGFVYFKYNKEEDKLEADCYGRSDSLGIDSDPENDNRIINTFILNNHL